MDALRLARIAAEAEGLRLRMQARRTAVRMATGLIGLMFIGWALLFVHVAVWYWLREGAGWTGPTTAIVLAGADLVIAACFAAFALRSSPGRVEMEALQVRQRALESATSGYALATALLQVLGLALSLLRRPQE